MKVIFEFLTSPLNLPIHWAWEYLVLLGLGSIAFAISYPIVGKLYDWGIISGRKVGSILHWTIRLLAFAGLWALVRAIVSKLIWFASNWWAVLSGVILLIVTIVGIKSLIRKLKR